MDSMKIYASLPEHIGGGFVWLVKAGLLTRGVVKITNSNSPLIYDATGISNIPTKLASHKPLR